MKSLVRYLISGAFTPAATFILFANGTLSLSVSLAVLAVAFVDVSCMVFGGDDNA